MVDNSETPVNPLGEYPDEAGENNAELVGISSEGDPYYHDSVEKRVAPGLRKDGSIIPQWEKAHEIDEQESLSDVLQEVEAAVGWERLTDRARALLGRGDDG